MRRRRGILATGCAFHALVAAVLLVSTWDRLYGAFGWKAPEQPIFPQVGGAFGIGLAFVLLMSLRDGRLVRAAAAGGAIADTLVVAVGAAWLIDAGGEISRRRELALVLAGFAVVAVAEWLVALSDP